MNVAIDHVQRIAQQVRKRAQNSLDLFRFVGLQLANAIIVFQGFQWFHEQAGATSGLVVNQAPHLAPIFLFDDQNQTAIPQGHDVFLQHAVAAKISQQRFNLSPRRSLRPLDLLANGCESGACIIFYSAGGIIDATIDFIFGFFQRNQLGNDPFQTRDFFLARRKEPIQAPYYSKGLRDHGQFFRLQIAADYSGFFKAWPDIDNAIDGDGLIIDQNITKLGSLF